MGDRALRALVWGAVAAAGLAAAVPAIARVRDFPVTPALIASDAAVDARPAQGAQLRRGQMSLQQAIEIATRRYPGRVVRASTTLRDGRIVHEIRILGDDSRVRTVHIDAQDSDSP